MTLRSDRRGDELRIADILAAMDRLESTRERGHERFVSESDAFDATIRRLEVVGEAAGKVTEATRQQFPEVPWQKMHGFASFATHEHWKLRPEEVWRAVEAIPALRRSLSTARVDEGAGRQLDRT